MTMEFSKMNIKAMQYHKLIYLFLALKDAGSNVIERQKIHLASEELELGFAVNIKDEFRVTKKYPQRKKFNLYVIGNNSAA